MAALIDIARLKEAMARAGLDQSALARDVGCTPGAINQIVLGNTHRSKYLPDIAERLGVTLRWLRGEDDSEQSFAPAPMIRQQPLFLRVELPEEEALAAMFESLLDGLNPADPRDEQARQLAQRLPIGLSQLVDARPAPLTKVRRQASSAVREADLATAGPGPRS